MVDVDLHNDYNTYGDSIYNLFGRREEGFAVPIYQREYTWEEDNIIQLFDDLILGVQELSSEGGNHATSFLGTLILPNYREVDGVSVASELRARPTGVQEVVDGQQRIATLALLAIQVADRLRLLKNRLPDGDPYSILLDHCEDLINELRNLYSVDTRRGSMPPNKPKIIRVSEDEWTHRGSDDSYGSPVAHYIATYIRTGDVQQARNSVDSKIGARVRGNTALIADLLDRICEAHVPGTNLHNRFPIGSRIVSDRMQNYVLGFNSESLRLVVSQMEDDPDSGDYVATAIYQISLLTYYFLRRCGINVLQPSHEEWGFDMFQALNATGTPLTAMETFLPQVIKAELAAGLDWESSPSHQSFDEIDEMFESTKTNEEKLRRTNDLLRTMALVYSGEEIADKFSNQRRWLTNDYDQALADIQGKRRFLNHCAEIATFYRSAWHMEDVGSNSCIKLVEGHEQGDLASLLLRYLRDANSKLSVPILARFYSQAMKDENAIDEFIGATKACAAFFTLWRSANSTSGLDDVFRRFCIGSDRPIIVNSHSWQSHPSNVSAEELRSYFAEVLRWKEIGQRSNWISASARFLRYTEVRAVCRFLLFIAGHDRVPDPDEPGLTQKGNNEVFPLLSLEKWLSQDYKSFEHIAPQKPAEPSNWDYSIYTGDKVHEIGNLLLLPRIVNSHIGNKAWKIKYLHYSHIGERSEAAIESITQTAKNEGIVLSQRAARVLSGMGYNGMVQAVLTVGLQGNWDTQIIDTRTKHIKEVAWEVLAPWLGL